MTKRDEAVFIKAFDKMEAEGFFDELREKARARKLREKARARKLREKARAKAKPTIRVATGKSEEPKSGKRSRKKVQISVSSQNVADKVPLAASKK
jgi:hypothetical protein